MQTLFFANSVSRRTMFRGFGVPGRRGWASAELP